MQMHICIMVPVFSAGATWTLYKHFMLNRLKFNNPASSCNAPATIVCICIDIYIYVFIDINRYNRCHLLSCMSRLDDLFVSFCVCVFVGWPSRKFHAVVSFSVAVSVVCVLKHNYFSLLIIAVVYLFIQFSTFESNLASFLNAFCIYCFLRFSYSNCSYLKQLAHLILSFDLHCTASFSLCIYSVYA